MHDDSLFRAVTVRICGNREIERGLHLALQRVAEHLPVDAMYLELFEEELGVVRAIARADRNGGERLDRVAPLSREAARVVGAVDSTAVRIINRPDHHLVANTMNREFDEDKCSLLVAPLAIEAERVGGLIVLAHGFDRYEQSHADLVEGLGEPFAIALSHHVQREKLLRLQHKLVEENQALVGELWGNSDHTIIGARFGLRHVMEQVAQVASSRSPVLLLGETGVGKDVLASAIHRGSRRAAGPFISVNCGAIPETLVDSELFGHEAGAFTGARSLRRGRFERADGGTLFLDEIGELPAPAQVRLLRVLQGREIERVGGSSAIPVDVRIVAATHRSLDAMVQEGHFREDLWFRLNVFPIRVPPLRERAQDLPALVHHILRRKSADLARGEPPELARGTLERLAAYDWPGNVRELENVLERALILHRSGRLEVDLGRARARAPAASGPTTGRPATGRPAAHDAPPLTLDQVAAAHINDVLRWTGGRIHGPGGAAELLGVKPTTLRNRMDRLGVPFRKAKRGPSRV